MHPPSGNLVPRGVKGLPLAEDVDRVLSLIRIWCNVPAQIKEAW